MKRFATCLLLAAAFAATTAAAQPRTVTDPEAPRSVATEGPVSVQWTDPAQFSELKFSGNRWEAERGNWVFQLGDHLRKEAEKRLPAGERLEVTITDIDRAGKFEPGRGMHFDSVRIMREIYPPMMELSFKRYAADGTLVSEGERRLRDMSYLNHSMPIGQSDNLRYEKRMIDEWLRSELGSRIVSR
jgi:hypothetical protein